MTKQPRFKYNLLHAVLLATLSSLTIQAQAEQTINDAPAIGSTTSYDQDTIVNFDKESNAYASVYADYSDINISSTDNYSLTLNSEKENGGFLRAKDGHTLSFSKLNNLTINTKNYVLNAVGGTISTDITGNLALHSDGSSGNLVQRGQELAFIVDTSTVFVEVMVPARYSNSVDSGQIVNVNIDAYPDTTFSGVVQAVDSAVDQKNHSIFVKASIDNEKQLLKHGLYANVVLVIGEKTGVILIPEDALAREGSIDYVWVIDKKDRAYRKRVVVGSKSGYYVEIVNGLQEGDVVVVAGHLKLSDGIKAQILNDMNAQTEQVTN